jgi:hypothetical protein
MSLFDIEKYEKCNIEEATSCYLAGKIYENACFFKGEDHVELRMEFDRWECFHHKDLEILGIISLKNKVKVPLEFEATIQRPLYVRFNTNDDYQNLLILCPTETIRNVIANGRRFKCIEVIDEDE